MKSLKSAKALRDAVDVAVKATEGLSKKDICDIIEISRYKEDIDNFRDVLMTLFGDTLYGTTTVEEKPVIEVITETSTPTTSTVTAVSKMNWLKYKGNIRWKLDKGIYPSYYKNGMMVSEEGDVWDLMSDSLLETGFYDGEMKAIIPGDRFATPEKLDKSMRIAPMVARVYGVTANDSNTSHQQMVIDYIDGDRRNLRPSNLKWIKRPVNNKSLKTLARIIADDICRRLVDNNGDVEKTLEMYPNSSNITSKYISDIRFKLIETDLSDKYFIVDKSGNFISKLDTVEEVDEKPKKISPAVSEMPMSMMSNDLLESKIRSGKLSIADKNLILYRTIQSLKENGTKKITAEIVVDDVRDKYKIPIPTDMADMMLKGGLV